MGWIRQACTLKTSHPQAARVTHSAGATLIVSGVS